jgi:hypothetical protein
MTYGETYTSEIVMRHQEMNGEGLYYARKKAYHQLINKAMMDMPFEKGYYIRFSDFYTLPMTWDMSKVCVNVTVVPVHDIPIGFYTFEPPTKPAPTKIQQVVEGAANWLADEVLKRILI